MKGMAPEAEALLGAAYAAYNRRDAEHLLTLVTDDVEWPDGERRMRGKHALREYWLEQWSRSRTHDAPGGFTLLPDGRVIVDIHQVVRTLDGTVVSRGEVTHVHRIRDGLIARPDIDGPTAGPRRSVAASALRGQL